MNREIQELREVITKLVPMLTGKGLKVTQRGTQAYVLANAKTNKPEVVNIPSIPDNASPDFISAISGFIDHEIGHVLFTDWKHYGGDGVRLDKFSPEGRAFTATHNIIEDTFVERKIVQLFPGSERNLERLHKHFLEKITTPAVKNAGSNEKAQFEYLMVPMMRALSGQEIFQKFMDDNGYWQQPMVEMLHMALSDEALEMLKRADSTQDTCEVAQEIHDIFFHQREKEEQKKKEEEEKKKKGQSQDMPEKIAGAGDGDGERIHEEPEIDDEDLNGDAGDGEAGDGEAEGEAQGNAAPSPSSESEEEGEDEAEGAGAGGDDEAEEEGDGEEQAEDAAAGSGDDEEESEDAAGGAGEGDEEKENEEEEAEGAGSAGEEDDESEDEAEGASAGDESEEEAEDEGESAGEDATPEEEEDYEDHAGNETGGNEEEAGGNDSGGGAGGEAGKSFFDLDPSDFNPVDLSSAMCQQIEQMAQKAVNDSSYSVFTKDEDRIEVFEVDDRHMQDKWVPDLDEAVAGLVGPMQKDIERMMAAQTFAVRTPGHRSGRLHSASLYRVLQGDPRVFQRKEEQRAKDTAVCLLIDNSGSMHGERIQVAMQSGYALAQTLERVNIPNEVIGFTTGGMPRGAHQQLSDEQKKGVHFSRTNTIIMPIFKEFSERVTPAVKKRIAYQLNMQVGMNTNTDGESLEYAALRLIPRREKRKVLIVMSDGQPVGSGTGWHLRETVKNLTKMGIETVGIGIQSNAVENFYPRSMVLNKVEDLPGAVMGELRRILSN